MDAVDLFAGWGGFTLGAERAGVRVKWAGNHSPEAVATHSRNHPDTLHECQDLRQMDWTRLPKYELLLASPACQGHSTASRPKRRPFHDAMRATAFAVIDCADVTEPRAIVVENVESFVEWRLYGDWLQMLNRLGYEVSERRVTASHHGVPQRRRRLFLIATRPGVRVPELTAQTEEPAIGPVLRRRNALPQEVWSPVETAPAGVQLRVARGQAKHGRRFLTQHVTGHSGVSLREPIRTITTAASHWNLVDGDEYRPLTGRELARGMGFPDSFTWDPSLTLAQVTRGLGNAVCPPVASAVVGAVADAVA